MILLAYNIDTGKRHITVNDTGTKTDYAEFMKTLLTEHYPDALCLKLVQDNLNNIPKGTFLKVLNPVKPALW